MKQEDADRITSDIKVAEAESPEDPAGCGAHVPPATLTESGGDWRLRIPADSVLLRKKVYIETNVDGDLTVGYPGTLPGAHCFVRSS